MKIEDGGGIRPTSTISRGLGGLRDFTFGRRDQRPEIPLDSPAAEAAVALAENPYALRMLKAWRQGETIAIDLDQSMEAREEQYRMHKEAEALLKGLGFPEPQWRSSRTSA